MSDNAFPSFQRINQTPLRDLIRGRITGRLDWKSQLAQANLPTPAADVIRRVVKRTRLWRLERSAVAVELIGHFLDGLEAGATGTELVERFGDERVAAKLIRRAKKRGRPLPWHALLLSIRVLGIVLAIWSVSALRFYLSRPTISVDYVARLNEPVLKTAESDRAWPIWRRVIVQMTVASPPGEREFPPVLPDWAPSNSPPARSVTVEWLGDHRQAIELAWQAASKPYMGYIYGAGGSQRDLDFPGSAVIQDKADSALITVSLPELSFMRSASQALDEDARLAAERRDGGRIVNDLLATLAFARQVRFSDNFLICGLFSVATNAYTIETLQWILAKHPDSLSDQQLIRLAHAIAGPEVAADLVSVHGERDLFADIVQRLYTDNQHGDGHLAFASIRGFEQSRSVMGLVPHEGNSEAVPAFMLSALPFLTASRRDVVNLYASWMDHHEADFRKPIRDADLGWLARQVEPLRNSPVERIRYRFPLNLCADLTSPQQRCERDLGLRDGTQVAIALETYRRQHGRLPSSLAELVPQWLPTIPLDRITGDRVKYRVLDGRPVIYSVGADRIDDGGHPPKKNFRGNHVSAADWTISPTHPAPHGDWILYDPALVDERDN